MADQQQQPNNNILSILSLIPNLISNLFGKKEGQNGKPEKEDIVVVNNEGENIKKAPDVVRFPLSHKEVHPLKLHNDDVDDTNPFILWQVYALGGVIVLRWAWAKWQERKENAKKDSSDEDQLRSPTTAQTEDPAPAEAED